MEKLKHVLRLLGYALCSFQKSPASAVSVRAIEAVCYKVINKITNEVLEEIEESKAFFQVRTMWTYDILFSYVWKFVDIPFKWRDALPLFQQ